MDRKILVILAVVCGVFLWSCGNPTGHDPEKSSNANLSNISLSTGNLLPSFSADITTYAVTLANSVTSITVTGAAADANAGVGGQSGQVVNLNEGTNTITLSVTAQDGTTKKDYVVTVNRTPSDPTNANLSGIELSSGTLSPAFSSGVTTYTVNAANSVASITITGLKEDANATVGGQSGQAVDLSLGANTITLSVTARDGTTKKNYVITVTRAAADSTNADLSAITVSSGTLDRPFSADQTDYMVIVGNSVSTIVVTGTKADSSATVGGQSGQTVALSDGSNTLTLTGTAQNGTTKNYRVKVYRTGSVPADYTLTGVGTLKGVPVGAFVRFFNTPEGVNYISVVAQPFRMSQHEITRAQWKAIMGAANDPSDPAFSGGDDHPVQQASWYQIITFCNKLSIAESLGQVYSVSGIDFATIAYADIPASNDETWNAVTANWSATGYRLPTDMEWVWAAMGAQDARNKAFAGSDGTNSIGAFAVFGYGSGEAGATTNMRTNSVGSKEHNELGLYDMTGNIQEYVWDWHGSAYYSHETLYSDASNGRGDPTGSMRKIRSSGWGSILANCTVLSGNMRQPHVKDNAMGFRVVRN
jgi:formylglycine-generating enzyme required for sulfatase activity